MGTQSPGSIRRTKLMLSEALFGLVEKRSFKKISVGDICEAAMVSRSAFYSHFADKYDLLAFGMEEKIRQKDGDKNQTMIEQITELLKNIQANRRTFHNLFMADLSPELLDILQQTLKEAAIVRLTEMKSEGNTLPCDIEMLAEFVSGGLANVILRWIRDNCAAPVEEIARCQCALLSALGAMEKKDEGRDRNV